MKTKKMLTRAFLALFVVAIIISTTACVKTPEESSSSDKVDISMLPEITLEDKEVVILSELDEASEIFETHYGGKVTLIKEPGTIMSKFLTMSMGGERVDLLSTILKPVLATQGYLQPIDEYFDFTIPLWKDIKAANDIFTHPDGKHYIAMVTQQRTMFIWYNKELFTENGIDTPDTYVKNNTWDWNVMRDMAKQLTIVRNGQYEQYGLSIDEGDALLYSCGKHLVSFTGKGPATNNVKSAEVARAINYAVELANVDKSLYLESGARQAFQQGKIAMIAGGMWYVNLWPEMLKNGSAMFVPFPKDPNADKYYVQEQSAGYMIPTTAENIEGAKAFIASKRLGAIDPEALKKSEAELAEQVGWTAEHNEMFLKYCLSPDKVGVPVSYASFDVGEFFGDTQVRPLKGEPWATIAAEISPRIDEKLALAYSTEE